MKTTLLPLATALAAFVARADLYVDASASPDGADGTAAKPYPTIQAAVSAASASNVIRVAAGVYTNGSAVVSNSSHARVYINGKPGLKIVGAGRGKSFIVGSRDPSLTANDDTLTETVLCVYVKNSKDAIVEGFTLRDGEAFYNTGTPGVTSGGGFYADSVDAYLVDSDIVHCCARVGGAMYNGTAVRCRFEGNYGMSGPVGRYARLVNCIASGNIDPSTSGTFYGGELYNCTVFGNLVTAAKGCVARDAVMRNCVAGLGTKDEFGVETNNVTASGCVFASSAANGYRQFMGPAVGDWRLLAGSDAVGAGEMSYLEALSLPDGVSATNDFTGAAIVADGSGRINAGAVQEAVTPAGGALAFISGAYEIDGHTNVNTFATYVYPDAYPTQYCVRAVLGEGEHLYRVERYDPATGELTYDLPAAVPSRDGTMWMMPPLDASTYLTNVAVKADRAYWVDPANGSNDNAGTSSDSPFATVSNAIASAKTDKCVIYLMPGEYTNEMRAVSTARGNFRLSVPNTKYFLRIVSTDGPESTVIRGRPDTSVENGFGSDAIKGVLLYKNTILQGVTIADCYSGSGGGSSHLGAAVFADQTDRDLAPPQIIDCIITNCHGETGITTGHMVARRCAFFDSSTDSQYAIYDNNSTKYGLPLFACYFRGVENNVSNASSHNGIIGSSAQVYQCTLVGTPDEGRLAGKDNISWNSIWYGGASVYSDSVFTNCIVYGSSGTGTGVYETSNPMFADVASSGALCANSPAIGAGGDFSADGFNVDYWKFALGDIEGSPLAFKGGKATLGAFQRPVDILRVAVEAPENGGWALSGGSYGTFDVASGENVSFVPASGSRPCIGVTVNGDDRLFTNAPNETVSLAYESLIAAGGELAVSGIYSTDWYVATNGDDSATGFLPTHPKRTLATAADLLSAGDTLWVFPGVYDTGSAFHSADGIAARVEVKSKTSVISLEGAEKTVIMGSEATGEHATNEYGNGTNAVRCAFVNTNARLDGFTLTGGRTYTNLTGTALFASGAAVHGGGRGKGSVVANCIISNNVAWLGAIYRADAFACEISGNIAFNGGSGSRESNVYGCLFSGNCGQPIVSYASDVWECTVADDNTSLSGKTALFLGSTVAGGRVFNSLFMGKVEITGSSSIAMSNCVCSAESSFSASVSTGNVWLVDFSTQSFTNGAIPVAWANAAVDAADESLCTNAFEDVDLRGFQRVMNGRRDIGAYEADWLPAYAEILGSPRWLSVDAADPLVEAAGATVLIPEGSLSVTLENASGKSVPYTIPVAVTGSGVLTVTAGDETLRTVSVADDEVFLDVVSSVASLPLTFAYTPGENDAGYAVLGQISRQRGGFQIIFR